MQVRAAGCAGNEPERLRPLARREQRERTDRPARNLPARRQAVLVLLVRVIVIQGVPRDMRRFGDALRPYAFHREQPLLEAETVPGVPGEVAVRADDAVARHNDWQGV